jgi:hypothetical protein
MATMTLNPALMFEKNKDSAKDVPPPLTHEEKERIKRNIYRSDVEKLKLFTLMLRRNALFKKAKIIHK